jgi:oxaloacetate decarboxylase alpha subunit
VVVNAERRLEDLGAPDRIGEVLEEVHRVRAEIGSPPSAAPIGQILVRQAIEHVLSGRRWTTMSDEMRLLVRGEWGSPPGAVDPAVRSFAEALEPSAVVVERSMDHARAEAGSLAASEEELCLVALFGDEARPLLEHLRTRGRPQLVPRRSEPGEAERIRALIALLEESQAGELTIEEGRTRITVKKQEERPVLVAAAPAAAPVAPASEPEPEPAPRGIRIESPMVGNFYRSPSPDQPSFVEEGDHVEPGQTLCILEAMKLFNELKADRPGTILEILVGNGDPVEFGQPLFVLDPS